MAPVTLTTVEAYADDCGNRVNGSPKQQRCKVAFYASGCELEVADDAILTDATFIFYCSDAKIRIGSASHFKGQILVGLQSTVTIGQRLSVTASCYISAAERVHVSIGDDCMFAKGNEIRADDAHPIFDIESGMRVNPSESISIGNHVWLAERAVVLSGSSIGDGSVVALNSVLKGNLPAYAVAAGSPARIIKERVRWERTHLSRTAPYYFPEGGRESSS